MKYSILSIIVAFSLFFCSSSTHKIVEHVDSDTILSGAIRIDYNRYIYIPVYLNDTIKANAMFDTGAPGLPLMDDSLASLFNFNYEKGHYMTCFLGQGCVMAKLPKNKLHTKIGNFECMQKFAVYSTDKFDCDIHLGIGQFDNKIIEIDLDKEYLKLWDSLDTQSEYSVDIIEDEYLLVPLTIITQTGKNFSGNFILDTGYPGMIMLFDKPENTKIVKDIPDSSKMIGKYLSGDEIITFKPSKVMIGGYSFDKPIIEIKNLSLKKEAKGLIGNWFFEMFNVKIDLIQNKLYLSPKPEKMKYPYNKYHSGIVAIKPQKDLNGTKYEISGIALGKNADKEGFKLGDELVKVNGKYTKDMLIDTFKYYFKLPIGTFLDFTIKREEEILEKRLVLEKLY